MSKRIFQNKSEPPLVTQQGRTPICYYHKQPITHFCVKKKCTLPLCQQCLPIHKKEHISNKQIPNEGILQFQTARQDALIAFKERKQEIVKAQDKFKTKIIEYKAKINDALNTILDTFCEDCLVTDGNLQIIEEIEQRTAQIKRGSLKQLIRYYEDIYGAEHFRKLYKMYSGQYLTNFKFEFDRKAFQKLCREGIKNLNFNSQKPALQSAQNNQLEQTPPKQCEAEIISQMPKIITNEQYLQQKQSLNMVFAKKIITEEDQQSQIQSYRLLRQKKKIEQGNIYTRNNSHLDPSFKNPSQNTSNVSNNTSKSKKKKGLSLAKSHKQLPSSQNSNIEPNSDLRDKDIENRDRKSNWKYFVNMKQTHPDNESSIPSSQPSSVLNPKQMRQLIIKKKQEQKQKELKTNKSAQFLVPQRIRN